MINAPVFGKLIGNKTLKQISSGLSNDPNASKPAVTTVPMKTKPKTRTTASTK